jgi:hypothetical protein
MTRQQPRLNFFVRLQKSQDRKTLSRFYLLVTSVHAVALAILYHDHDRLFSWQGSCYYAPNEYGDRAERRDNGTVESILEAAVMGAFLADAASLGLHGWVVTCC